MGRRKKEKIGTFDRIGEEVNLEKCPECSEHPDCFCWMEGKCTALKESGGQACGFYRSTEEAMAEARQCFRLLVQHHRTDLIQKYFKALSALGLLDEEIEAADEMMNQLQESEEIQPQEDIPDYSQDQPPDQADEEGIDGTGYRCLAPME